MSKIVRIYEKSEKSEMRQAWQRIFKSNDHSSMVFQPEIESCLIFPHTGGHLLSDDLYPAITDAAIAEATRTGGDHGFYFSGTYCPEPEIFDEPHHWWCGFPPHDEFLFLNSPGTFENAMYARDSSWGVAVEYDWHALVGGSEDFIRRVDEGYPEWRQEVIETVVELEYTINTRGSMIIDLIVEMLEYWKKYPADEWVEVVTANIKYQLRQFWKNRPGDKWAAAVADKMNLKLDKGQ